MQVLKRLRRSVTDGVRAIGVTNSGSVTATFPLAAPAQSRLTGTNMQGDTP